MLLKRAAILFGAFLLVGILGFIPAVAPNQMLLGYFTSMLRTTWCMFSRAP
jgi:hypothetical protein